MPLRQFCCYSPNPVGCGGAGCWREPYPRVRCLYCCGRHPLWDAKSGVDRLFVSLAPMYLTNHQDIINPIIFQVFHVSSFLLLVRARPPTLGCGDTRNEIADIVGNRRCAIVRGRPAAVKKGEGRTPDRSEREIGKGARNGRHPFHAIFDGRNSGLAG